MGLLTALAVEAEQGQAWKAEYMKLLALVAEMQAGKVNPQSVTVDLRGGNWSLQAPVCQQWDLVEALAGGRGGLVPGEAANGQAE